MPRKLTKIVATLGPACDTEVKIADLIDAGVNVFRFNTKHGEPEWHEERIKRVQKVADEKLVDIGILLDLQGPEIRIETRDKDDVSLDAGEEIYLGTDFTDEKVSIVIPETGIIERMEKGDWFFIDDGKILLEVARKDGARVVVSSNKSAIVKNRKGVNFPDKVLSLPSLVAADFKQLDMASLNKVDFVALSFVRDVEDVNILKKEIEKRKMNAKIVAKIENKLALKNLDEIIEVSDAIMVARGDMGIEVAIEEVAYWQKIIIEKCRKAYKPVITATEMLESMTHSLRPTRAEATDVSNAVFDGTDAVMLSGETALGDYPIETVATMTKIAGFAENANEMVFARSRAKDMTQLIAMAAMEMAVNGGVAIDKIVVFTHSGYTARVISSFRPNIPVIAITDNKKTVETLTLSYGVTARIHDIPEDEIVSPVDTVDILKKTEDVEDGDSVLVVHGARWKTPGLTNSITFVKA